MNVFDTLQEVTRRIIAVSDPEQIILFGSHARGEAGADSDIDVLVVARNVVSPRQESVRIQRALRGLLTPVDVVVATPQHLAAYGDAAGLIYRAALREGKVLYERSSRS